MTTKSYKGYLFNMVLPLIFFEWWNVLLAFVFVVIIEAYIVKLFIKEDYKRLFSILFKANLITTLGGYFFQGIVRVILGVILYGATNQYFESYPIIQGILGNVGIGEGNTYNLLDTAVIATITTSIILAFILSVIIERKILINATDGKFSKRIITKSILLANIVSYILLTAWICFKFTLL